MNHNTRSECLLIIFCNSYLFISSFIFSYLLVSGFVSIFLCQTTFLHVFHTCYFIVLLYLKQFSFLHGHFLKSVYSQSCLSQFSISKVFQFLNIFNIRYYQCKYSCCFPLFVFFTFVICLSQLNFYICL